MPNRIRSSQGRQNLSVANFINEHRETWRGSLLTGKSTNHQGIKQLWKDVFEGVLALYCHKIFTFMEENAIRDLFNEIDLGTVHYVYIPLINEKWDALRHAWLRQQIRTVKLFPLRLWVSGQINFPIEIDLTEREQYFYGVEGVINWVAIDKTRPIYSSTTSNITTGELWNRTKYKFLNKNIHLHIWMNRKQLWDFS